MNDNQRIFLAFFILVVAALNANSTLLTGQVTKGTSLSGYPPLAAAAALTYCQTVDLDGDGVYTNNDLELANQYFSRGGDYLRNLPVATKEIMDVYPVEEGNCGDERLTQKDLLVLTYMREDQRKEQQGNTLAHAR
ncbi:MAG: hypothetical protein Q7R56_02110, partial [Nanoarchaeota archaeon]|nr:hypothetical protein [Nanoarchaeota archaeon]